ncbi:MAG: MBL fold metallo-hydrolase [Verrucomicrobiota bacterium]|nr:MBL fold metallo-hydrolase [Verrucomicrobiota bacterium]
MVTTPFICSACGTQFSETTEPPLSCPICEDSRQFVPPGGQQWTTLEHLRREHRNSFRQYEGALLGIGTTPEFAIGQRALLLRSAYGNFLWDCIPFFDDATCEIVRALGGLRGIAISHPHYYSTMVEWSRAFDDAPIYLHADDREWVMRPNESIEFWEGRQKELAPGVTLIHCGGHFAGGTVLHWREGSNGNGALLSGDVVAVGANRTVSFMYSYPNIIPLPASAVRKIAQALEPFSCERVYGAFWERVVLRDGKKVVAGSVHRYFKAIGR